MTTSAQAASKKQVCIKYSSLAVLVLQNTSLVLFMRYVMTGNRPHFLKEISACSSVRYALIQAITVFYAEIFKFFASVLLVCLEKQSLKKGLLELYTEYTQHKADVLKVLVPAVVYTIQNFLLYVAIENLPSATFMVTYQLKILTTAVFTVLVLHRRLSVQQWIALFFLFAGVAIVQYDQKMSEIRESAERSLAHEAFNVSESRIHSADELEEAFDHFLDEQTGVNTTVSEDWFIDTDVSTSTVLSVTHLSTSTVLSVTHPPTHHSRAREQNSLLGFSAVLVACFLSGFAGIYFEKILKTSNVSLWIRNIQLALPSIFFSLFFAFVKDRESIFVDSNVFGNMMHGFDWAVWVTVAINAFGGLVVAVVIKFADNILKAFATSFAIVFNCILSYFLFKFRPTMLFVLGACMVIGAVFVYSIYPYKATHQPVPTKEEDANQKEMQELEKKDGKQVGIPMESSSKPS